MAAEFPGRVLVIGYGSVARCMLPLFLTHVRVPPARITVIDALDKTAELAPWMDDGLTFSRVTILPENLDSALSAHVSKGDLIIDVAWSIDCGDIITWCHDHDVLYVNTSIEVWDPAGEQATANLFEKSLYHRQVELLGLTRNWGDSATCVVDHGANPGLISHFAKQGLCDIANRMIADGIAPDPDRLCDLICRKEFARLAMETGVKVIHCSERDTQVSNAPKQVGEFVGTWCIGGMLDEGIGPAEMGWGTHEKELPSQAHQPSTGPKNEIILARPGINTWVRSWVPGQEIVGMLIQHGEAFGLSHSLTVREDGDVTYRPTVLYAYMPCDATIASLHELRSRNYELQPSTRIMDDSEIVSGSDTLGALLMGHPYQSWWTGSILSIDEARQRAPGQNATTLQVAIGVVAAVVWAIANPRRGFCLPEDLPHEFVLGIAQPYLGKFCSCPTAWTPLRDRTVLFRENPNNTFDHDDVWQFGNFLFMH
jgi:homospermidine synthase